MRLDYSDFTDWPAIENWKKHIESLGYTVQFNTGSKLPNIPNISEVTLMWIHGHNAFSFGNDLSILKSYLENGGTLWEDDCSPTTWNNLNPFTSSFLNEMQKAFGTTGEYLSADHPFYSAYYIFSGALPTWWSSENKTKGIILNGVLAVIMNVNDYGCALEDYTTGWNYENGLKMATNATIFAATKHCQK